MGVSFQGTPVKHQQLEDMVYQLEVPGSQYHILHVDLPVSLPLLRQCEEARRAEHVRQVRGWKMIDELADALYSRKDAIRYS